MQWRADGRAASTIVGSSRSERFRAAERRLTLVSRLMDDAVRIPGTRFGIGLDPIIGLIPVVGDVASAAVGLWIIVEAARFDVPLIVLARMVWNTLVDMVVGAIPVIGDLFDFVSRSNEANLRLFRRHAADPTASTAGHVEFFVGLALVVLGVLWLLAQGVGWLLSVRLTIP